MARARPIVHPSDFSPASGPALKKAIELAREEGAPLAIVHVLPALPIVGDAYMAPTVFDEMLRGHRAQARRSMEGLVSRAKKSGVKATGTVIEMGPVADGIARFAKRAGAGLIVMGTHGHGVLARALLGSVAQQVINRAPCPVMTLKAAKK